MTVFRLAFSILRGTELLLLLLLITSLDTRTLFPRASALDNGLGLTPPMGWLSWERFGCNTDCINDPDNCISSELYLSQAQLLVTEGYKYSGYVYVNIDDCWSLKERNHLGDVVEDPVRFPNGGLKTLGQKIHSLGLKFGLYTDIGTATCAGYPGVQDHMEQDAIKFATLYEIDSIKVDGCNADPALFNTTFPAFSKALNETGRPILYNCIWPLKSTNGNHGENELQTVGKYCNLWRNYYDVLDDWSNIRMIIDYWSRTSDIDPLVVAAGPGHFNDPDMLVVGNPGLSISEQQIQFGLWAIFAAPLYISADLRIIPYESQMILQNRDIIAINQDPTGKQGYCVEGCQSGHRIFIRELQATPIHQYRQKQKYLQSTSSSMNLSDSWAIALVNLDPWFGPEPITFDIVQHLLPDGFDTSILVGFEIVRDCIEQESVSQIYRTQFTVSVDESSMKMYTIRLLFIQDDSTSTN